MTGGGFVTWVRTERPPEDTGHPFTLPVVRELMERGGIGLDPGVTFLVGENGSGKSTLIEALAVVFGMNLEGGSRNFRFSTRPAESPLADCLVARWHRRPRTDFFLRAESFYNAATYLEQLPGGLGDYGGRTLHERSHGQSFLDVVLHRFGPDGLYLLDEPEAALSVRGCLALLRRMADLRAQRCQFVVATHSPILLALPDARILQIDEADGTIEPVGFDEAEPVLLTRRFLADPSGPLRELFAD